MSLSRRESEGQAPSSPFVSIRPNHHQSENCTISTPFFRVSKNEPAHSQPLTTFGRSTGAVFSAYRSFTRSLPHLYRFPEERLCERAPVSTSDAEKCVQNA